MVILKASVRETGPILGTSRHLTSHPKDFFSSKLNGKYQLIRREGLFTLGRL